MGKVKNEHYIPQFYLKRLAKNGDDLIDVYDKINDKEILNKSPVIFACEKYFYDIDNSNIEKNIDLMLELSKGQYSDEEIKKIKEDEQLLEHMFLNMEGDLSNEFKRLEKDFDVINESSFKVKFYIFIRDLAIRTSGFRATLNMITGKTLDVAKKMGAKEIQGYDTNMDSEDIAKLKQADYLTSLPELIHDGNIFLNSYSFYVGVNNSDTSFIISDQPSLNVLYGCKEICFPISPKLAIIMRKDGTDTFTNVAPNEKGIIELDSKSVLLFNCFQYAQAKRFVFGDIDVIRKIVNAEKFRNVLGLLTEQL